MARILIVEDDQALAFVLNLFFSTHHDVAVATTKCEALTAIASQSFDYLISDYLHSEAIPVLQAFREKFPTAPSILTTGWSEPDLEKKVYEAGATHMLYKPLALSEFSKYIPGMSEVGQVFRKTSG